MLQFRLAFRGEVDNDQIKVRELNANCTVVVNSPISRSGAAETMANGRAS